MVVIRSRIRSLREVVHIGVAFLDGFMQKVVKPGHIQGVGHPIFHPIFNLRVDVSAQKGETGKEENPSSKIDTGGERRFSNRLRNPM